MEPLEDGVMWGDVMPLLWEHPQEDGGSSQQWDTKTSCPSMVALVLLALGTSSAVTQPCLSPARPWAMTLAGGPAVRRNLLLA